MKNTLVATRYFILMAMLIACNSQKQAAENIIDEPHWVADGPDSLHIETFKSVALTKNPMLLVVIHGDAPFNNPSYQYTVASKIAAAGSNLVTVGILRPGYTDPKNFHSPGIRGLTTGDNYTKDVIDKIAVAVQNLKALYHAKKVFIAGHSGGSAITADVINSYPALADGAAIVSCPCDVDEWRKYMKKQQGDNAVWDAPVTSLSPIKNYGSINSKTKLLIITGDKDSIAPSLFSEEYFNLVKTKTAKARLMTVKDGGHEIFLDSTVLKAIGELVK